MLRAVIFDFDGVIADAEPLHLKGFQEVLATEGIELTEKEYFDRYLAFDDKRCFEEVLKDKNKPYDGELIERLIQRKSTVLSELIKDGLVIFPGVVDLIKELSASYPLAIGSGALRGEIDYILKFAGLRDEFDVIVSAEDVTNCKPEPEVFLTALEKINERVDGKEVLCSECLVVEDSIYGLEAAGRAGMKCLAVTNSYSPDVLKGAEMVVTSLEGLSVTDLQGLF